MHVCGAHISNVCRLAAVHEQHHSLQLRHRHCNSHVPVSSTKDAVADTSEDADVAASTAVGLFCIAFGRCCVLAYGCHDSVGKLVGRSADWSACMLSVLQCVAVCCSVLQWSQRLVGGM